VLTLLSSFELATPRMARASKATRDSISLFVLYQGGVLAEDLPQGHASRPPLSSRGTPSTLRRPLFHRFELLGDEPLVQPLAVGVREALRRFSFGASEDSPFILHRMFKSAAIGRNTAF